MASNSCLIFFNSGRGDLNTAYAALADRGLPVTRAVAEFGDQLAVQWRDGLRLRIAFNGEPHVREEAAEIGESTPHAAALAACDARYEIDDLAAALDEINTLIEVQLTLGDLTGGYLFNTWNGELSGPPTGNPCPR